MASLYGSFPLSLIVRRKEPVLVRPAKPTPTEMKQLSDIDDQEGLRFQVPLITFYAPDPSMHGEDPAPLIRQGIAQALVFYYPFAGRLVEGPNRKLSVHCTGEGVLFTEADADIELCRLGVGPGSPYLAELLHDVPGSGGILGCPLLLIQVTRFKCGGFVLAVRLNHTMSDGPGLAQFLNAIAECAGGDEEATPSVWPVWDRVVLSGRQPPRVTCFHREFEQRAGAIMPGDLQDMIHGSFIFGPKEISAIQSHLRTKCTTFEALTACIWRTRTRALEFDPNETVQLSCLVNGRGKLHIPPGYYGNAFAYPAVVTRAATLAAEPLGYAVALVKATKAQMSEEYLQSVADLMVTKGRPLYTTAGNFLVSDNTRSGFDKVDFGWGRPAYGGPAAAMGPICFYGRYVDGGGRDGVVAMLCLPRPAMERFERELKELTAEPAER